ncbi:MAG: toxin-activating lysine-acyltransferase [Rickettsiales bacterium]|nr:toxin-activating lysine-acyltransferase [Rickettsiales bacterium]
MTEKNLKEKTDLKMKNENSSKEIVSKDNAIKDSGDSNTNKIKLPAFISLESALGAVSMLAMKSANHKYLFVSDYEWLVIPPVALKQFVLFRTEKNEPIAFISWASINEDVEKRLLSGSIKLKPQEWNSGDKFYIIDMISPFGIGKEILKQLNDKMFKDKDVRIIRPKKDGKGIESKLLKDVIKEFDESKQQLADKKANVGEINNSNKQVGSKIINKLPTAKA